MVSGKLNVIELGLFTSRLEAICEEMGAVLQRSAFSPNIKDRLDFSCAIFDSSGKLSAQAAHIPVHLGSMAFAMEGIVNRCHWLPGDMVVVNDPYLGGTHLPDVTVVAPVFIEGELIAFVANRAHHANIGANSPGSMPISTSLDEEGIVIAPTHLIREDVWQSQILTQITEGVGEGDFIAQVSTNRVGIERLSNVIKALGRLRYQQALYQLNDYGERIARSQLKLIPDGCYQFTDYMDDDGAGLKAIPIKVSLSITKNDISADFTGTAEQVPGNINCPLSVAAAAVFYVFRCLMPLNTPSCAGVFRPIKVHAPKGCLVNAERPSAVAAGNVETSTRITDVVLGALAQALPNQIPAASHGSMNNVAMGNLPTNNSGGWDYYETIGGGMGASFKGEGLSAIQTHMTNTLNTPVESLEMHYPLRVRCYQLRRESGGAGLYSGGDGIRREFEFIEDTIVTLLTERRAYAPWGLNGGASGSSGRNILNGSLVPAKCELSVKAGDRLMLETPGGGAWGNSE